MKPTVETPGVSLHLDQALDSSQGLLKQLQ